MKKIVYLLILAILSSIAYAQGFRSRSTGNANFPPTISSNSADPITFNVGNPTSISGTLDVPSGTSVDEVKLIVTIDGVEYTATSSVSVDADGEVEVSLTSPTLNTGATERIQLQALSNSAVVYVQNHGTSVSIPNVIGTILTDSDLTNSDTSITAGQLIGVLSSSNTIDNDILTNLADLNAEIDEQDHGCTLAGGASATNTQGRDYLICVMEAHYTDEVNSAFASFTAPNPATLEICNTDELCGPAPSICDEVIFTCSATTTNFPVASGDTVTAAYNGTDADPVNFDSVDTTSQIGTASYTVSVALANYPNGIAASANNDFAYSTLEYSDDVYTAVSVTSSTLTAQTVNQLSDMSIDASTVFSYVNADNSIDYSITLADGTAAPSWVSIDEDTGEITGTPPITSSSSYSLKVTGTDSQSASASATLALTVSGLSTDQLATYSSSAATDDGTAVYLKIPTNQSSFAEWESDVTTSTESNAVIAYFHYNATEGSGGVDRLSVSEVIDVLGASNLSDGDSSLDGLTDSDGNLITLASSSSNTGGYAIIALNERQNSNSAYQHGILQLIPLSSGTTTSIASNTSTSIYMDNKPYGFVADTASDVSGSLALSGATIGDTISIDFTGLTEPDGDFDDFDISYQWYLDNTAITGATSSTYDGLYYDEAGSSLKVTITYTDDAYYEETVTSVAQTVTLPSGSSTLIQSTDLTSTTLTSAGVSSEIITELDLDVCGADFDEDCLDFFNEERFDHDCTLADLTDPTTDEVDDYVECVVQKGMETHIAAIGTTQTITNNDNSCVSSVTFNLPKVCSIPSVGVDCSIITQPTSGSLTINDAQTEATYTTASDWEPQPGGMTVTYTLRYEGWYFSNDYDTQITQSVPSGGVDGVGVSYFSQSGTNVRLANIEYNKCYGGPPSVWNSARRLATKSELATALGATNSNNFTGSGLTGGVILFRNSTTFDNNGMVGCSTSGVATPYRYQSIQSNGKTTGSVTSISTLSDDNQARINFFDNSGVWRSTGVGCNGPKYTGTITWACTGQTIQVCPD